MLFEMDLLRDLCTFVDITSVSRGLNNERDIIL